MVSYNVYKATSSGAYVEGVCLASDEKPVVGIANGSILYAVDASNGETTRYMYDKSAMAWIEAECPCSGGSGSGGGSGGGGSSEGPLIVTLNNNIADKTFQEIQDALSSGGGAFVRLTTSHLGANAVDMFPIYEVGKSRMGDPSVSYYDFDREQRVDSTNSGDDAGPNSFPEFPSGGVS
jgi:hypothetical protein